MAVASDLILDRLRQARPCFWKNSAALSQPLLDDPLGHAVDEAEDRLKRSTRLLWALFPGLKDAEAPIKSPLVAAGTLGVALGATPALAERLWVKADHQLPIAGSVKARGGFHEVIAIAEKIALGEGLIVPGSDLAALDRVEARTLFSKHSIVVGSTGNLGMSIGLIASALGFRAVVHMSSGAKAWKKDRLRRHGAEVVEHRGDYAQAVLYGRQAAEADRFSNFVDDEQSIDLFTGYAAAARELVSQLRQNNIAVDADHPLFVYIPCGVGGAPGGIAYGLKRLLGPHVHCLFAEPVQSPCMLVQLASGSDDPVSVYDLGLTNRTEADGLAVGQASMGRVACDRLVLATNAYSHLLAGARQAGLSRRQIPLIVKGTITEPISASDWSAKGWKRRCGVNVVSDLFYSFAPTADGRILHVGGYYATLPANRKFVPEAEWRLKGEGADHLGAFFPKLANLKTAHTWGGPISLTPDWIPHVGRASDPRVVFAFGCWGHGMGLGMHNGVTLAELTLERKTDGTELWFVTRKKADWPPKPITTFITNQVVASGRKRARAIGATLTPEVTFSV